MEKHMSVHTVHVANVAVAAPTIATIFGYLPIALGIVATLLAIIVYGLQIVDWFERRQAKAARSLAVSDAGANSLANTVSKDSGKLQASTARLMTKLQDAPTSSKE